MKRAWLWITGCDLCRLPFRSCRWVTVTSRTGQTINDVRACDTCLAIIAGRAR